MKTYYKLFLTTILASPLALAMTHDDKIEDITKILQENPLIVDNLHENLHLYMNQQKAFEATIAENYDYMYNNPNHTWLGSSTAKTTIINFTDYSCPWCKKLDDVLNQLVDKYPNDIKVVNIYVPIKEMSSHSNSASFALNVWENRPEKFTEIHELLIKKTGIHDQRSIERIAKTMGLEDHIKSDALTEQILARNYRLFNHLGMQGTPGMLLNGKIIPGYVPFDKLEALVKDSAE
ncbi:DsbA family protein [Vibrio vulnificus]|nr:DsbA family protein [Vibrio vulnificus]EKG2460383.1 DsbA family protein [Vibrio vulnificus]